MKVKSLNVSCQVNCARIVPDICNVWIFFCSTIYSDISNLYSGYGHVLIEMTQQTIRVHTHFNIAPPTCNTYDLNTVHRRYRLKWNYIYVKINNSVFSVNEEDKVTCITQRISCFEDTSVYRATRDRNLDVRDRKLPKHVENMRSIHQWGSSGRLRRRSGARIPKAEGPIPAEDHSFGDFRRAC